MSRESIPAQQALTKPKDADTSNADDMRRILTVMLTQPQGQQLHKVEKPASASIKQLSIEDIIGNAPNSELLECVNYRYEVGRIVGHDFFSKEHSNLQPCEIDLGRYVHFFFQALVHDDKIFEQRLFIEQFVPAFKKAIRRRQIKVVWKDKETWQDIPQINWFYGFHAAYLGTHHD